MKRVAICGSEEKHWTPETRTKAVIKIRDCLLKHAEHYNDMNAPEYDSSQLILVSGGCPKGGVDIYAEIVADTLGIKKEIYEPQVNQWVDWKSEADSEGVVILKGYKSRNIQIAEACDIFYCIDAKDRAWSGGRWTMNYARKLGKEVHLIEL